MKLSFVIPAYNEENYIGRCLNSIQQQIAGKNYDLEIIVVNNASIDGTKAVALSYPGVKVVDEPRKGLSQARQTGFLAATGDLVANIDADTMLTPGWIDKVLQVFSSNQKLVAYSGPFVYYDLTPGLNFLVRIYYFFVYLNYLFLRHVVEVTSNLQGGNFVIRKSALNQIGGYNTNFVFYGEDADIARRLNKIGPVVFSFALPIFASGRRLQGEGLLMSAAKYVINYFWTVLFKKPFSKNYNNIRSIK